MLERWRCCVHECHLEGDRRSHNLWAVAANTAQTRLCSTRGGGSCAAKTSGATHEGASSNCLSSHSTTRLAIHVTHQDIHAHQPVNIKRRYKSSPLSGAPPPRTGGGGTHTHREGGGLSHLESERDVREAVVADQSLHVLVKRHGPHHHRRLWPRLVHEGIRSDALPENLGGGAPEGK